MHLRLVGLLMLALLLVACDGNTSDVPLPTLAQIGDVGNATPEPTTPAEDPTPTLETDDTPPMADTDTSSGAVEFELPDDSTASPIVGEATLTVNDGAGNTFTTLIDLPEGWTASGDTVSNGAVDVVMRVHPVEGEALISVIEAAYPGTPDIQQPFALEYGMILYAYDGTTLYLAWNTVGDVYNPILVEVTGSVADMQAAFADIVVIGEGRELQRVEEG